MLSLVLLLTLTVPVAPDCPEAPGSPSTVVLGVGSQKLLSLPFVGEPSVCFTCSSGVTCVWRDDSRVRFTAWAFGFPGTEHARGFVWSREPLPNEFPCVDSPTCFPQGFTRQRRETVHARIDGEWALFAF